jgi:uncharacterized damage-inducible protein DinB
MPPFRRAVIYGFSSNTQRSNVEIELLSEERDRSARPNPKVEAHMTVHDLENMFDYGYWANRKLFETMSHLSPEQFTQTVDGSHGSIRNTMVHVLSAEWGWLGRCGGPERGAPLNSADYPTVESLVNAWNKVEMELRKFLSTLRNEDLARIVEFVIGGAEKRSMPVGVLLQHAANHSVHHRGQLSLLLRMLGYNPDNFDILLYFAEKHSQRAL